MSDTFNQVADIIAETSEIPREEITQESHTIDDLGIDSLDFLDIVFAIDLWQICCKTGHKAMQP